MVDDSIVHSLSISVSGPRAEQVKTYLIVASRLHSHQRVRRSLSSLSSLRFTIRTARSGGIRLGRIRTGDRGLWLLLWLKLKCSATKTRLSAINLVVDCKVEETALGLTATNFAWSRYDLDIRSYQQSRSVRLVQSEVDLKHTMM